MTYIKDIKLCVDCAFYGNHVGQRDKCIHPKLTTIDLVTGGQNYSYCYAERRTNLPDHCGEQARFFVLNADAEQDRLQRLAELEEAMRDAPTL